MIQPVVRTGADLLVADGGGLRSMRLGMLTHDAARLGNGTPVRAALQTSGLHLVRLFSPEHGLFVKAPDGAPVEHAVDGLTGLPVVSLYGFGFEPPREALGDLDAILIDLQDIGARFYTYVWATTHMIDACARQGIPVVVLDRPNPLGGSLERVEGPLQRADVPAGYLGRMPVPIRHSLTIGEMARLWVRDRCPTAPVSVLAMEGWKRSMLWPDTGLEWFPPSPAMRSFEAAILYPGLCLFEATNVSVGRGTGHDFEVIGAPWLDPVKILGALAPDMSTMGREVIFTPASGPGQGEPCRGIRFTVDDPEAFRPVAFGLRLLDVVCRTHPGPFAWCRYPTAANPDGDSHLDRLLGIAGAPELFGGSEDVSPRSITRADGWSAFVADVLLYP
jgi:uncharacterized protein YbbC (DUF1343 family)